MVGCLLLARWRAGPVAHDRRPVSVVVRRLYPRRLPQRRSTTGLQSERRPRGRRSTVRGLTLALTLRTRSVSRTGLRRWRVIIALCTLCFNKLISVACHTPSLYFYTYKLSSFRRSWHLSGCPQLFFYARSHRRIATKFGRSIHHGAGIFSESTAPFRWRVVSRDSRTPTTKRGLNLLFKIIAGRSGATYIILIQRLISNTILYLRLLHVRCRPINGRKRP